MAEHPGRTPTYTPVPLLQGINKGLDGAWVAHLTKRLGGGLANRLNMVCQGHQEGLDSARVADLAERRAGSLPHFPVLVSESTYEGPHGTGVADLAERLSGICRPPLEGRDERPHGTSVADLTEGHGGGLAHPPVLLVSQRLDQATDVSLGLELADVWRSEQRHGVTSFGSAGHGQG
jgi:hypothetical protein